MRNMVARGTLPVSGIAQLSADEFTPRRRLMKMWPPSYFRRFLKEGRPSFDCASRFPEAFCSAPHDPPFCSRGRDARASSVAADTKRCIFERGGDFVNEPSLQVCFFCSRFCCCCWSSCSAGTYGVNVGGKIFSCLEGRWRNVDARRLMNPQVKQQ